VNKKNAQGKIETSGNTVYSYEKASYTGSQHLTPGNRGSGSRRSKTVPSAASRHYGTYTRRGSLADLLRIKLTEVLYVPWVVKRFSIVRSQVGTSRTAYLGHVEGALPAGGELVSSFSSEHQIIHLELSAAHKPLLVVFECLVVPCIFNSRLSSSFINEVKILTSELVLCGFVVCLDT
jgi:hypothetical protein